jgi:hypothetical protein
MEKKELASILSEILVPIGFKKKGNYWVVNGTEITKMINLQKSQFGNYYYINWGYIINSVFLDGMMHIYNRVASVDKNENLRIDELLDLENNISDTTRESELKIILHKYLIDKINQINTVSDLKKYLKSLTPPLSNTVPLVVKKHFNLE